jgi:anthranilate phosphoribosyltransferase
VAEVLGLLGCKAALVVHGQGLDEIAIHGPTTAALYKNEKVTEMTLSPEQVGMSTFPLEQIRGGEAKENARAITDLLKGDGEEAHKAVVAINAGALAWVFGKSGDLEEGTKLAWETINSGNSFKRLVRFGELSHGA